MRNQVLCQGTASIPRTDVPDMSKDNHEFPLDNGGKNVLISTSNLPEITSLLSNSLANGINS